MFCAAKKLLSPLIFSALIYAIRADAIDYRGSHFVGFTSFQNFQTETNSTGIVLISPPIDPAIEWNELIPSWNYTNLNGGLICEIRVRYGDRLTKWYCLGRWASNSEKYPRESVKHQKDDDGDVATDTLEMKQPAKAVQMRITLSGTGSSTAGLEFLGLSFSNTKTAFDPLPPNTNAWGKSLTVKERSQANYPEGISSWCSPTSTSMLLSFWASQLNRPDLDHDVPEVALAVNDPNWPGTGNWPFNMAYAGEHHGIRAYVTRFRDVSELETWIEKEIPVAVSLSYNLLKGKAEGGSGHLVVCIGFTEQGDPIFNDPGRKQVHQVYKRENLIKAWAESHNTVYLVYQVGAALPRNLYGHWSD